MGTRNLKILTCVCVCVCMTGCSGGGTRLVTRDLRTYLNLELREECSRTLGPGMGMILSAVMRWGSNCTQKVEVAHKEEALPPFCTASDEKLGVAWERG